MADDIDDLLDEVETKYCSKGKPKLETNKKHSGKQKSRRKLDDDIDDILGVDDDIPQMKSLDLENNSASNSKSSPRRPDSSRKCFPVYLGGASHSSGMASSINKRLCDRLRCTSCDFKVCNFENFEWSSNTDYLFLRNNVPDFEKLKSNLVPRKELYETGSSDQSNVFLSLPCFCAVAKTGLRAYCCQCSWRSVRDLEEIRDLELKWVCGRH